MRIIFSAGGTGGHLYPAIALADYISKQEDVSILFVGSNYRIEATKVSEHGYDFHGLDIKTPSGSFIKKVRGYLDVFANVKKCQKIIRDFKPDIVIGFGGYTSYSIMQAALKENVKTILHEQNSVLGKSNKVLAKKVDALISAYDISNQYQGNNVYCLGNPTSYHVLQAQKANLNDYGLSNDVKTVLIVMGSQGSAIINEVVKELFLELSDVNFQIIYISGINYYSDFEGVEYKKNIKILGYENKLTSLIKACDLIVSRAGASALTEIISANKPAILIPSIHVTNNHQCLNAIPLEKAQCAIVVEEDENTTTNLLTTINELMLDDEKLESMKENTKKFNSNDSAMNIYSLMKKLVGESNAK